MLRQLLVRLERATALDRLGDRMQSAVHAVIRPQRVRDLLHGVSLGHPLHPALVQLPVGAFMSAAVLDAVPGQRRAATVLTAVGAASALPAAAAGWTDWAAASREQRRVGLVHATANVLGLGLYAASLWHRLNGRHDRGRAFGYAGLTALSGGAYLGGHLSYAQGAGISHAAVELRALPGGWVTVADLADLPESQPAVRHAGSVPVLLYRYGDRVSAMIARCSHQSGPLGDGKVLGSGAEACVVCPWHGSTFRLADGAVVHGPAANDQPLLRTRVQDGRVAVAAP